ncbi:DUF4838 domain-containing protein [Paenibacillus contaminans]|nr:DUF4838 domain-containing protein [Paenibacillus contaminans]
MNKKRWLRKFISLALTGSLLFTFPVLSHGEQGEAGNEAVLQAGAPSADLPGEKVLPGDVTGHWAEKQLAEWWGGGLLTGYPDGKVKPDESISRGEFMALVNRLFGYGETMPLEFTDVKQGDWTYAEASKALRAGYMEGYGNGTIGADRQISRQEAAVIIARLFKPNQAEAGENAEPFTDAGLIAEWSRTAVADVVGSRWMEGYGDGSFRADAFISRAEAIVTIDRALKSGAPLVYDRAGTYGPETGTLAVSGNVAVRAPGVTLRNMSVSGAMLLDEAIGEGDVRLKNVKVAGTTTVRGGGENSVHFDNSVIFSLVVDKASGTVRIAAEGSTVVASVIVKSSVILEHAGEEGGGFEKVELNEALPSGARIVLQGTIGTVDVLAGGIKAELAKGTVKQMNVSAGATGVELNIGDTSAILSLIADAVIKVLGQGTIESAALSGKAKDSTFEKQPKSKSEAGSPGGSSSPSPTSGGTPTPSPTNGGTSSPSPTPSAGPLTIVENGQADAVVLVPSGDNGELRGIAETLVDYVRKSTGAILPIMTEDELAVSGSAAAAVKLYVGAAGTDSDPAFADRLTGLSKDGFVISPYGGSITIAGPSPLGTEFGVYDFLERYVGVRWLMPGEAGEDVPALSSLSIPSTVVREQPAMISRDVVGFMGYHTRTADETISSIQLDWAKKNRNNSAINFHHNLYRLFPPSEYLTTHPEFFPHKDGQPRIPALNMGWQPCFTAPGIVEEAVANIIAYFDENPDKISYSLGVIDGDANGGGFCETTDKINSLGVPDMSDIYYDWVNKVAEGVLQVYPDKYFGLLAYAEVFDPPSFKLNPRVIPNITDERFSWADPRREQEGKQLMDKWMQSAEQVAWYDYIWGSPYVVPRIFNHQMADYLRYAKEKGVIGYFAELYPNFGEGPKPWLTMKLLWNPDQDEEALAQEWYERAVGEEAAADLKQYYDHWEQFWMTRSFQTDWYSTWYNSNPRYNFMPFNSAAYLTDVTVDDIETSRQLLESVVQKAGTPEQLARAQLLLRSFEYYEASALSYPIAREMEVPADTAEALQLMDELIRREAKNPAALAEKRQQLIDEFETDPILVHPIRGAVDQGMTWSGQGNTAFLLQWIAGEPANSPIRGHLRQIADSEGNSPVGLYAEFLLQYPGKMKPLNTNVSFEEFDGSSPIQSKSYGFWYGNENRPPDEVAARTDSVARTGSYSIAAKGITLGSITQEIRVQEPMDFLAATAYYYTPPGSNSSGRLRITMNLFDESWNFIGSIASNDKIVSGTEGQWSPIRLVEAVPESAKDRLKIIQLLIEHRGFAAGETVYVDDVVLKGVTSGQISAVKASAENGSIVALLSDEPNQTPGVSDFTITQKIGNGEALSVVPSSVSWNAANLTATLTLPVIPATETAQSVVYTVKYRNSAAANAAPFTVLPSSATPLGRNTSFEDALAASPIGTEHWGYWYNNDNRTPDEAAYRTDTKSRTGAVSIAAKGISLGSILHEVYLTGPIDSIFAGGYYYAEPGNTNGKVRFTMRLFDESWTEIGYLASPFVNVADLKGEWLPFQLAEAIPDNIKARLKIVQLSVEQREFAPGETIYIDDVNVYGVPSGLSLADN